jgi:hypothetical protein
VDYELVFEEFDEDLVCFAAPESRDPGDDFGRDPLMIPHAEFDGGHDPQLLLGHEMEVLV